MGQIVPAAEEESIRLAADVIRKGGLVAFPTETVYGLGCDALNPAAVARVFEVKERPAFDPLIVHIATEAALDGLVEALTPRDRQCMNRFWPGPLTLIMRKHARVPDIVTAGLSTIAIRMPAHPVAQALIREAGVPIAAPSANPFGYVSPTCAQHVRDGLGDRVDLILDGGPCLLGLESTILSTAGTTPEVLRPGSLSLSDIVAVMGPVLRRVRQTDHLPLAPGQLARHYATRTPLTVMQPGITHRPPPGERAGLLAIFQPGIRKGYAVIEVLAPSGQLREAAHHLFAALRRLDALGLDHLYAVPCEEQGLGLAIMDRLRRCAAPDQPHASGPDPTAWSGSPAVPLP
jgi:L-threonylcarbamoyladenylate synthase